MDLATQRVPTPSLPWRQLGVLALIAILIATALAVYVGSQPRLPDPFGPAANGVVAYESDGVIHLFDPATDTAQALDTDAEGWRDPWFAPNGRDLLVAREVDGTAVTFGVVSVDGGDIRVITPEPLRDSDWIEWSPDSRSLITLALVKHARGQINVLEPGALVLDTVNATVTEIPTPPGPLYATYLPPHGERILVMTGEGSHSTIWTMRPDGSDPVEIMQTEQGTSILGRPSVSPDGRLLAYAVYGPYIPVSLRLRDLVSGEDRPVADDPAVKFTGGPRFSPDGTTLAVERAQDRYGPAETVHLAFIDVATGAVTPTDVALPDGGSWEWSPDGSALQGSVRNADDTMEPQVLVDRATGRVTPAPWTAVSYPSWQRLAR